MAIFINLTMKICLDNFIAKLINLTADFYQCNVNKCICFLNFVVIELVFLIFIPPESCRCSEAFICF